MGFLLCLARKISLQNQQNDIQFQLMTIDQKLQDYTTYATTLSQDSISASDLANIPSSLFTQALSDLTAANTQASTIAQQNMQQAQASGVLANADANTQLIAQQKMYENARKQIQKQLQAKMNEEEKSLTSQKTRLEAQQQEITEELSGLDNQIGSGIKSQVSKYSLGQG